MSTGGDELTETRRGRIPYAGALFVWLLAALIFGSGSNRFLERLRMPASLVGVALTIAAILLVIIPFRIRRRLLALDPLMLVGIHLTRFLALYMLLLWSRQQLPFHFAVYGATGELLVALGAVLILLKCRPERSFSDRSLLLGWNALGLASLVFFLMTAANISRFHRALLAPLDHLPLSLLPTFLLPLFGATHVLIFIWTRRFVEPDRVARAERRSAVRSE